MPTVPITPTRPLCVAGARLRTPGSITPTTGTSTRACSSSSPAAAAVLHATMRSFTSCSPTRRSVICSANPRTSSSGRGPVRVAAGVAQVDEVLGREEVDQRPGDGEAAEAAVEHADRAVVHPRRLRRGLVARSRSRRPARPPRPASAGPRRARRRAPGRPGTRSRASRARGRCGRCRPSQWIRTRSIPSMAKAASVRARLARWPGPARCGRRAPSSRSRGRAREPAVQPAAADARARRARRRSSSRSRGAGPRAPRRRRRTSAIPASVAGSAGPRHPRAQVVEALVDRGHRGRGPVGPTAHERGTAAEVDPLGRRRGEDRTVGARPCPIVPAAISEGEPSWNAASTIGAWPT